MIFFRLFYSVCYSIFYFFSITQFNNTLSTSEINPYKDIQKILSEDFNPHVPKAEQTVLPWKMNYSYKDRKILEFKDKSEFPLQEVCNCSLEEMNEQESNIIFGSGSI